MQEIIANIRAAHRERCFAMEQRKRADLSLLSFLRTQAGWRLDLPEKDRKAIAERAKAFADGVTYDPKARLFTWDESTDGGDLDKWRSVVEASVGARAPFEEIEKAALKNMEAAAVQLPAWEAFGKDTRGFGAASLAVIVGEAGDLSIYSNPAKLWKRMGIGIVGDIRQGGLAKSASKESWIEHGYSRQRRSRMWNIGEALLKKENPYRDLYLIRLAYEHAKALSAGLTPASAMKVTIESWKERGLPPLEKVTKLTEKHRGAGHMHNRARRYVEKRLLRDLWVAWGGRPRSLRDPYKPSLPLPPSDQQASESLSPNQRAPAAATGQCPIDTQGSNAGRSHSNSEAIERVSPSGATPRKRRTKPLAQPVIATSGAPIQQATGFATPIQGMPADAPDLSSPDPQSRAVRRSSISRSNGTGGQSPHETQLRRAAR
jgi:hypothetical protein